MVAMIRSHDDVVKVALVFHLLVPTATCAGDSPILFNAAKDIALRTLRHSTALHIILAPRGST
jgi:hypothetical protein